MSPLPTHALSVQQPWAWLIVRGHKDIENRTWKHSFRGPVLIHAGKKSDKDAWLDLCGGDHPVTRDALPAGVFEQLNADSPVPNGGIVGVAEIVDCVTQSESAWFVGRYGFVLRNARPLPFMPLRGQLGFFAAEYQEPAQ